MRLFPLLLIVIFTCNQALAARGDKGEKGGKDRAAPTIHVPETIETKATSVNGAVVNYSVTVTDNKDPSPTYSCAPASGSQFPMSVTTVVCDATDAKGNQSKASFLVRVVDSDAPSLSLPADIEINADSDAGVAVEFQVAANDAIDGDVAVSCSSASGDSFPVGVSSVDCAASDSSGNNATGSFNVSVLFDMAVPEPEPVPDPDPVPPTQDFSQITVSWVAPTTREDGSSLPANELAGFDVYVIAENSGNDEIVSVGQPNVTQIIYQPKQADIYHFSVTAYDTSGVSSQMSTAVSVIVE